MFQGVLEDFFRLSISFQDFLSNCSGSLEVLVVMETLLEFLQQCRSLRIFQEPLMIFQESLMIFQEPLYEFWSLRIFRSLLSDIWW